MKLKDIKCPDCGEHDNLDPVTVGPFYDDQGPGVYCPKCDEIYAITVVNNEDVLVKED